MIEINENVVTNTRNGKRVRLPSMQLRLFKLLQARGQAISTTEMIQKEVWGWNKSPHLDTGTIRVTLCHLRDNLESIGLDREFIETVRGVGLRMNNPQFHVDDQPTAKEIAGAFPGLQRNETKEIAKLMTASDYDAVDRCLKTIDGALDAYGVEVVREDSQYERIRRAPPGRSRYYMTIESLYVNRGDTYDVTVVYDTARMQYYIMSFGDWYEQTFKEVKNENTQ